MSDLLNITGTVDHIIFKAKESLFTVFDLTRTGSPSIKVVVNDNIFEGEELEMEGKFESSSHGRQFVPEKIKRLLPVIEERMVTFLSSDLIEGIGPVLAKAIVDKFGTDTYKRIENQDDAIMEIRGISKKKAEKVWFSFHEYSHERDTIGYLLQYGMTLNGIRRIKSKFGQNAIQKLKENPYRLKEVPGFGFRKADSFAMYVGIEPDSMLRMKELIIHILEDLTIGHTYLTVEELTMKVESFLVSFIEDPEMIDSRMKEAIIALKSAKRIKQSKYGIHSAKIYNAEKNIARRLTTLIKEKSKRFNSVLVEQYITAFESQLPFELGEEQREAIKQAFFSNVNIITGNPGTGKTLSVGGILSVCEELGINYKLAAPTGRAAKRMTEQTGKEASTIHRLLEYRPGLGFTRNKENPLVNDLYILDEGSMIDVNLMSSFLDAVPDGSRFILLGDVNQLASIGAGDVLRDIIDSNLVHVSWLTKIHRQSANSFISVNAAKINKGDTREPLLYSNKIGVGDFSWSNSLDVRLIDKLVTDTIPNVYGHEIKDIQVLTPYRSEMVKQINVTYLNKRLQGLLNPKGQPINYKKCYLRKGDRVMQTVNNYDKDVFNGDTGYITDITVLDKMGKHDVGHFFVKYPDKTEEVLYEFNEFNQLQLAYASTVHKFQGSEVKAAIIILPEEAGLNKNRSLVKRYMVYTAITRAKELCLLMATEKTIKSVLEDDDQEIRNTLLTEFLLEEFTNIKEDKHRESGIKRQRKGSFKQSAAKQ